MSRRIGHRLWPVPVAFALVLAYHYPRWVETRQSLGQYFDGVYRSRVVGREAILGIANAVDWVMGTGSTGSTPGFAAGWVVVTVGGLVLAWWLFELRLRSAPDDDGRRAVVLVGLMAASATVLTPYDYLSYALIIATVVGVETRRLWLAAVLMGAAMATRESAFLVVPILAAERLTPTALAGRRHSFRRWRTMVAAAAGDRTLWTIGAVGLSAYLILKLGLPPARGVVLLQPATLAQNFGWGSLGGLLLALALVVVGRTLGPRRDPLMSQARRLMWVFALPYLAVLAVGSSWGEAPRLVMPLVIGEALIASGPPAVTDLRPTRRRAGPSVS